MKIEHNGIIKKTTNTSIIVEITVDSACASCQAKSNCSIHNSRNTEIEINTDDQFYKTGEEVKVLFLTRLGYVAVILAYVIPIVLVIGTILILRALNLEEGFAGLLGLGILLPYYFFLYLFRKKLKKEFSFSIHKMQDFKNN